MSEVKISAPATPDDAVRVCLVAITKHGAAQAQQLAQRWPEHLPAPHICTSSKFGAVFEGGANPCVCTQAR